MKFFTIEDAKKSGSLAKGLHSASAKLNENASNYRSYNTYDIFLSHSVLDAEVILGVTKILEEQGYKVYVDWIEDPHLDRANVTKKVAEHIRNRMKSCRSLVYATSNNAANSKWMPWELGFFDGFRPSNVFILPLLNSETDTFQGREYLTLYPVIGKAQPSLYSSITKGFQIHDAGYTRDFKIG